MKQIKTHAVRTQWPIPLIADDTIAATSSVKNDVRSVMHDISRFLYWEATGEMYCFGVANK